MARLPDINLSQLGDAIRDQAKAFSSKELQSDLMTKVAELMMRFVDERFSGKNNADGGSWGKRDMVQTGELMRSYRVITKQADKVVVGPTGERNVTIAEQAAERWNILIAGMGPSELQRLDKEFEAYLNRAAGL